MQTKLLLLMLISNMAFSQDQKTFHDYTTNTLEGEEFNLSQLKGKKVLVVNTASKCGFTSQYKDLQALYEKYGGDKFTIIGFPANNFGKQEPGTNTEIAAFCQKNYGVTFLMMNKISVKGDDIDPIYKWLTNKEENGVKGGSVKWNFQKYLIDEQGRLVQVYSSMVNPASKKITAWIEEGIAIEEE